VKTILLCRTALVRIGLQHLLAGTNLEIVGACSDLAALAQLCSIARPALFVLEGNDLREQLFETVGRLKEEYPDVRIAVIADAFDGAFIQQGQGAGVDGFCLSGTSRDVLIKYLELAALGESALPVALAATLLLGNPEPKARETRIEQDIDFHDPRTRRLSAREAEILGCLMEGAPNKVIARKLEVAEATIKVHVKAILRKIGAANRTQAAMWASSHLPGIAAPSEPASRAGTADFLS